MEKQKTIRDYIILSKLGTGSYGVVYKVKKINTNNIFVIKQIPMENLTSKQIYEVKQEAKILSSINSIYVVKYYDSFEENKTLNIVMEYCDGGDLSGFLQKNKKTKILLKEDLVWTLFLKITIGLAAIHNLKILHRDLKALNIFLTKDLDIKIGDLGVAKILTHTKFAKTFIGTPYYLSPEICQDMPYNDKSDVWALGCILYELCTYRHPFEAKSQGALILKILRNIPSPIHSYYSNELQDLIYSILEKDGEIRPSCYDILTTPNIMEKARKLGLINKIINLYPYNNNNINYDYYQKNNGQYIYDNNNNNIYEYYNDGYNNNYIYDSNIVYQNNYYYEPVGNQNKSYYIDNYEQKYLASEYNNVNENKNQKGMVNSNSEGYIKNNYIIKNKKINDNNQINNNNNIKSKFINNINKKICSCCLDKEKENNISKDCIINNNNNIFINNIVDKRNEVNKILISPRLKKHRSDVNENNINDKKEENNINDKDKMNKIKITYINSPNAIKYIKKPIQNIKELFRNRSNDNLNKEQKLNIQFNNRKESNKINPKNVNKNHSNSNIIEIKKDEKKNQNNIIKKDIKKVISKDISKDKEKINEVIENQNNTKMNISKSDRKNEQKLLDTITEFANNLNKYVNQHNSAQRNNNIPSKFTLKSDLDELKSEECPKDNIRNKNKNNENNIVKESTTINSIDDFKIINNNENENKNDMNSKISSSSINSKDNENLLTNITNIDCTKINSIIENHKTLKILRNVDNNGTDEQNNEDKEKEIDDNLYSSEEEKNGNIYDSEEESDSKSEIVKEIKDRKIRDSSMSKSLASLSNEEIKNKLTNERDNLKEKIINIKNDMLKLIGEEDYNYIIDLYTKVENNSNEEIYQKIEQFFKDKYQNDKKEKFGELYISLITHDCQLTKKEQLLKKYI